jgi:hypothetical protein
VAAVGTGWLMTCPGFAAQNGCCALLQRPAVEHKRALLLSPYSLQHFTSLYSTRINIHLRHRPRSVSLVVP